jgi:hypothetical protein
VQVKHPAAKGCTDDDTLTIVPIYLYTHLGLISWRIIQIESQMLQQAVAHTAVAIRCIQASNGRTDQAIQLYLHKPTTRRNQPEQGRLGKQLPTVVYDYNNTVHSATGFTPHFLLFGWHPTDICVPLVFQQPSLHPNIDLYPSQRAGAFTAAQAALEKARSVMIAARGASLKALEHSKSSHEVVDAVDILPLHVQVIAPAAERHHEDAESDLHGAHLRQSCRRDARVTYNMPAERSSFLDRIGHLPI